ncbi:disulfide bond formation protein DsbA [Arthrobacter glacialis]|uniref:Disulfide bond formation protein DsbA n=2 Tax=Arthrobacter glacialis TaxID=1664 RepID=A0A2S3ZYU3_ARTGL|nr:disulfide bond formation protein DsbA [Arthrobacter glacialis]
MGENPVQGPENPQNPPGWTPPHYGQQPPYGQYPPMPAPGGKGGTNTLAIVSLVSSFFVGIAGVITGHIALSQIKRTGEEGKGLAIAGLVIGYVMTLAAIVGVIAVVVSLFLAGVAADNAAGSPDGSNQKGGVSSTGNVPENSNAFGGIAFGQGGALVPPTTTDTRVDLTQLPEQGGQALDPAAIGIQASANGEPMQLVVFIDFMCPHCAAFEQSQGPAIQALQDQGKITVEYRPIGYLDRFSAGTNYSSRSAAAAACVASESPQNYKKFLDSLFTNQPAENSEGLDAAELGRLAQEAGAADITDCMDSKTYRPYVAFATGLASTHGVQGTPTVFMDGVQWQDGSFTDFAAAALAAKK